MHNRENKLKWKAMQKERTYPGKILDKSNLWFIIFTLL